MYDIISLMMNRDSQKRLDLTEALNMIHNMSSEVLATGGLFCVVIFIPYLSTINFTILQFNILFVSNISFFYSDNDGPTHVPGYYINRRHEQLKLMVGKLYYSYYV